MFFQNNKWIRTVAAIEAYTIFLILYLGYLLLKRLVRKVTGKNIDRG